MWRENGAALTPDLVLHGDRIKGHVDAFDGSKGGKGLSDGVLPQLIIDGAHVYATHDGEGSLALSGDLSSSTQEVKSSWSQRYSSQRLLTDCRGDSASPKPMVRDAIWKTPKPSE